MRFQVWPSESRTLNERGPDQSCVGSPQPSSCFQVSFVQLLFEDNKGERKGPWYSYPTGWSWHTGFVLELCKLMSDLFPGWCLDSCLMTQHCSSQLTEVEALILRSFTSAETSVLSPLRQHLRLACLHFRSYSVQFPPCLATLVIPIPLPWSLQRRPCTHLSWNLE